jgi:outer membrane receptor protein involved in Fe transport
VDEVFVTGSRIIRSGYDAPTPVTVFGAAEIDKSADPSLLGALGSIPALSGSQTNGVSHGRQGESLGGMQSINLRALGSNRVLVLLDGVRLSPSSYTNFVDVSTVPSQLISRVEVVTGGASAVYGSDAVAGVVNFVLDRKFTGLKADFTSGQTNYGDGKNYQSSLTGGFGFAEGRGHVLLSGERMNNDGTEGTDGGREWNREGWGLMANPAYTATNGEPQTLFVSQMSSSNTTAGGIITAGPLRGIAFGPGGEPYQFQYGPISGPTSTSMAGGGDWEANSTRFLDDLDPAQSSYNLFGRADFDVTENINVFGLVSYGRNTAKGPFGSSLSRNNAYVYQDNAYLPASVRNQMIQAGIQRFVIGSWNADMPKGPYSNRREATRYIGGVEGKFTAFDSAWSWNATYAYGRTDISLRNKSLIVSRALSALDAVADPGTGKIVCRSTLTDPGNGCLPWNFMGTGVNDENLAAGAFEWMTDGGQFQDATIEQRSQEASVSGEPFSLPAGPVSLAASLEHRTDEINSVVDQYSAGSLRTGSNYGPLSGKQSVTEIALESILPLAKKLDLSLAARATDYEYSGSVTTWKVGTTYSPIDALTLRLTRSRDIRAPNIRDLFAAPAGFGGGAVDRFQGNAPVVGGFFTVQGNPDLRPEAADTTGVGIVVRPPSLPGFGASVDYWSVNIKDAIQELQAQDVVDACYYAIDTSACSRIERGADGNIDFIRSAPLNLAKFDARGVDVELSYRKSIWRGELSLRSLMTFYLRSVQESPFSPRIDLAGTNIYATSGAATNSLPNWKLNVTAAYEMDRLSFSLTGRGFADGEFNNTNGMYTVCQSGCPPVTGGNPTINYNSMPGRVYLDANVNYELNFGGKSTASLFFSVRNALDRDPPPLPTGPNLAIYDVLGRVYRVGIRFSM